MYEAPPVLLSYAEYFRQMAFLSAVFGGFAATFLGTLLTMSKQDRVVDLAIGFIAFSATSFILAALSSVTGVNQATTAMLREAATAPNSLSNLVLVVRIAIFGGAFLLFGAIGLCGWARSRFVGWQTSTAAALGVLFLLLALSGC